MHIRHDVFEGGEVSSAGYWNEGSGWLRYSTGNLLVTSERFGWRGIGDSVIFEEESW